MRGSIAVFCGLVLMSLIAEPVEFLLVALSNGGITTDQDQYFQIRNRTPILVLKFLYNGLAATMAGYATAAIAVKHPKVHGHLLAIIQSALFVWGMTLSEFAGTTPKWFWIPAVPLMYACNVVGATLYDLRAREDD
ncbi:MAG: hypothetical protein Aurels2KO_21800 [Aureliella sp.]